MKKEYIKLFKVLKNDCNEVENEKIIGIKVSAKKYFECDANKLKQCKETDYCLINIDFENESSEFCWVSEGDNPANFPYENDNFEDVVELLEEVYL